MPVKQGFKHTEASKARTSRAHLDPTAVLLEDQKILRELGTAMVFEYAEKCGIAERIAHNRLVRLVEEGYAHRFRKRGHGNTWIYVATMPVGMTVRED
jgi:hypothetical protein